VYTDDFTTQTINGSQQLKKDGRRALFALMQTYSPVSTNAGNNANTKLEATRFK
jgi:hypothetical protein